MTKIRPSAIGLSILFLLSFAAFSQTPSSVEGGRGVIRLRVRVAHGNKARGLSRKRFFLFKGSLEDNQTLMQSIQQQSIVSRDCYYRSKGASEALIGWLRENDCESVYCREVDAKSLEGAAAVPEFQRAVATGEKEFGSRELARKWITVNLANELRSGFYKLQQENLKRFLTQAESLSHAKVASVMTDRNGTAYFTDIEPGAYVISNILPSEFENTSLLWEDCAITVKPGNLATELPFLISNPGNKDARDKNTKKCISVEKPLPVCESPAK